uniref:alkaline phosphatase n=1 Tax=Pseudoclavibacter sp. RFBI5 TaxID=2080578 RepID=UPI001CA5AD6C|nr:alkaline phosphatase [Pseudoclavibacter sp. RFBI5]
MPSIIRRPLAGGAVALTALAIAGTAFAATPAVADETGPKNVIVLIGDGMGYNFVDLANAHTSGETYYQVTTGGDKKVIPAGSNADRPTEGFQSWDLAGMSTNWAEGPAYDPAESWTDFEWNKNDPTDSAAAGTAMATGVKTYNAGIGVDVDENVVENLSERANSLGKSTGVVTSVPFSHATPAAYSAHNVSRNDYHGIAAQQLSGEMDVVIGAGHPFYDDDNQPLAAPNYQYVGQAEWEAATNGASDYAFLETNEDFAALTEGDTPEQVFGVPQVGSTLQQGRTDSGARNDVPGLATLTEGALNVLDNNDSGMFLMVEGGAIDWTGHANQTDRALEETLAFNDAVDSVIDWVETESSWDETLVVVTADHETGYLSGPVEGQFTPMTVENHLDYATHSWNSTNHTNQLVPFFYKGAGAEQLTALADQRDPLRGHYLDNTEMAQWLLTSAWVEVAPPAPTVPTEPTATTVPTATTEPTATATNEPTATTEPTASTTASATAPASAAPAPTSTSATGRGGDSLATTGAEGAAPIAIGAGLLLAAGITVALVARRRAAPERE